MRQIVVVISPYAQTAATVFLVMTLGVVWNSCSSDIGRPEASLQDRKYEKAKAIASANEEFLGSIVLRVHL